MTTHNETKAHVVPLGVLIATWLALLVLTGVTVAVAKLDLGQFNIVAALGIASVKATIVALIFMHLKYGGRYLIVVFVASVVFAVILIGFVLFDSTQYQPDIIEREAAIKKAAAEKKAKPPTAPAKSGGAPAPATPPEAAPAAE